MYTLDRRGERMRHTPVLLVSIAPSPDDAASHADPQARSRTALPPEVRRED
jgi:hypothetical protein